MEDFNSKYSGEQVEALLDQVASGNAGGGGGGIAVETDPIFSASPAASITEEKMVEWDKGATAVQPETLSEYALEVYVDNEVKALGDSLAKVATSGSYSDLSDKPTIPSAVTESTVSGWGFTKNTGTYSKPSTGIPKSDLASAVQTSLGKADTALQSYTEKYTGTITGISVNGTSVATSGVANIPAASTSKYGVTKLTTLTNSSSTTLAATASAVKAAYDLASGKASMSDVNTAIANAITNAINASY